MKKRIIMRSLRCLLRTNDSIYSDRDVQLFDQKANDYIRDRIHNAKGGLMIAKFGTVELNTVCCYLAHDKRISFKTFRNFVRGRITILPDECFPALCNNAGFFPEDMILGTKYMRLVLQDAKMIDVLGSYLEMESMLNDYIGKCVRINLNGYYAPFMWENPWTSELKGKKVLVVHPFVDSIKSQYSHRDKLFVDPNVLPEFGELKLIKAIQSITDNDVNCGFDNWFEALDYMKKKIDQQDYDVALIGCGAYGMHLAAHVKRQGKIAIHLAGWTQMLFGIYGNRWIHDQPEFSKYINEFWTRPLETEKPRGVQKVENACYW